MGWGVGPQDASSDKGQAVMRMLLGVTYKMSKLGKLMMTSGVMTSNAI